MKRGLSLLLTIVMVVGIFANIPVTVNAASVDNLTFSLNGDGMSYTVTGCSYNAYGPLFIPETHTNGRPVTRIAEKAFDYCESLTSVTIPDSVTSIGNEAFRNCVKLESVVIGKKVTSIGYSAFYDCTSLTSITIPDSVTNIGSSAFSGCTSLISVTIGNSVTSIGDYAFYNCNSLTSINIPNSVTSIGEDAFYNCTSLNDVYITDIASWCGISFVNQYANPLSYAENLYLNGELVTDLVISDSVTSIGSYAFFGCDSITSITIPDSVTRIGYLAFSSTGYSANSSNWDNCMLYIGNHLVAAYDNTNGRYPIKAGTKTISRKAFYDCTNLYFISIPDSVTSIGEDAFYNTMLYNESSKWQNGVLYIGKHLIEAKYDLSGSYTIRSGTITIANNAFEYCESLTSITIPNSVITVGDSAFYKCRGLTSITIPDSVTNLGSSAFRECTRLTSITVPDSVTSIGSSAFRGCSNLTSINIPASVTSIGNYAFSYCESLTAITIPDSVTRIGSSTFRGCLNLTSINIPDSVKSIGSYAFYNCNSLELIVIPDSVTRIGSYAFEKCISLGAITLPNSVTSIGQGAFLSCTNLSSITIPDGVITIGASAFEDCTSLTAVTIPNSVTNIGDYVFENCISLASVIIGNSVTSIGSYALYGCTSLTSIIIPDSVTSIGNYAFYECTSLTSITIPDSVTSIGSYAFYCCKNLKEVNASCKSCARSYFSDSKLVLTHGSSSDWIISTTATVGAVGKKVKNCTVCGDVVETATIPQLKPATPKTTTTNEIGGVNVTWNKVDGAVKYNVYRRQGGYSTWTFVGTTRGTTLLDKNVKSGIYYVYSVRAYNNVGQYSDFVTANTQTRKFMAVPQLASISNATNGLYITWKPVDGVTNGYRVYRRGAGSTYWTYLGTVKTTNFTDTSVKARSGEYFRYTVIADGGYHSKFDTTGLYLKRLANPTLTSTTSSTAGITVKWEAVMGTTGYYVYRKTASSTWVRVAAVGGTNNTSYLDKTAQKGTTYTYTVRAVYGATISSYNSGISCYDKY